MNRNSREWPWRICTALCYLLSLALLAVLFGLLLGHGAAEWNVLWNGSDKRVLEEVYASIRRTLILTLAGMAFCLPFGVGGALWLAELSPLIRRFPWIPACIRTLARVPAVLYGLAAALLLPYIGGPGLWACCVTAGLVMRPCAVATLLDALAAVPEDQRAAGAGAALLIAWSGTAATAGAMGSPLAAEILSGAAASHRTIWACALVLTAFTALLHLTCAVILQIGANRRKGELNT